MSLLKNDNDTKNESNQHSQHDHNCEMNHSNHKKKTNNESDLDAEPLKTLINDNNNQINEMSEKELKTENNAIIESFDDWRALKEISIEGTKCKLVPYTVDHVSTYNKWLNDPHIQQMTQTQPYTIDQEYEYQQEWKLDEKKYIFIILDKTLNNSPMCGDINIFIIENEQHEHIGELNIMIAENKSQRKGLATETLQLIIKFARKHFEIKTFIAKISNDNHSSIKLFKKLGFVQTDFIDAFKEYTFTLTLQENNQNENDKVKFKKDKIFTD